MTGRLRYVAENLEVEQTIEPVEAPRIVPPLSLTPHPERIVMRSGTSLPPLRIDARNNTGETIETRIRIGDEVAPLRLAPGHGTHIEVRVPTPAAGRYRLEIGADGVAHGRVRSFAYDHIGRTGWIEPAAIEVLVADLAIPEGIRIGYVDGDGTETKRVIWPFALAFFDRVRVVVDEHVGAGGDGVDHHSQDGSTPPTLDAGEGHKKFLRRHSPAGKRQPAPPRRAYGFTNSKFATSAWWSDAGVGHTRCDVQRRWLL